MSVKIGNNSTLVIALTWSLLPFFAITELIIIIIIIIYDRVGLTDHKDTAELSSEDPFAERVWR